MKNKKGFTIVELVIVIAVIAILAGVLIPTFSGVVEKANKSAAMQSARQEFSMYMANAAEDGRAITNGYIKVVKGNKNYWFEIKNSEFDSNVMTTAPTADKYSSIDLSKVYVKSVLLANDAETIGSETKYYSDFECSEEATKTVKGQYTNAEVDAHNADLPGAKLPQETLDADEAAAYNASLDGAISTSTELTAAQATKLNSIQGVSKQYAVNETPVAGDDIKYNASLDGALNSTEELGEKSKAYNLTVANAWAYGLNEKPAQKYAQGTYYYTTTITESFGQDNVFIYAKLSAE